MRSTISPTFSVVGMAADVVTSMVVPAPPARAADATAPWFGPPASPIIVVSLGRNRLPLSPVGN